MARYTDAVCRICRREGDKLFLKGDRCTSGKCALDRRSTAPGQHGAANKKVREYGMHLREKQKVRRYYGLLETQFRNLYNEAERKTYKTMLDWHNDHQQAIDEALNIATSNGYVNGAKWKLWDQVCKDQERKLNIHPN